jgi:hypothetical protein
MYSVIVFAGPSIGSSIQITNEFDVRPPACCGDILRAMADKPRAIGLIDGVFETIRSPWHKEILFAMSRGIALFGASSMGALRAAELAPFGMIGVGKIFEAFRDGSLEDDDEVAVLHGPAELGYENLTKAMVNVRASLEKARSAQITTQEAKGEMVSIAKQLFYKDRTWQNIFATSVQRGIPQSVIAPLEAWLPFNEVDLKREDALMLLRVLSEDPTALRHRYRGGFRHTIYFNELRRSLSSTRT